MSRKVISLQLKKKKKTWKGRKKNMNYIREKFSKERMKGESVSLSSKESTFE